MIQLYTHCSSIISVARQGRPKKSSSESNPITTLNQSYITFTKAELQVGGDVQFFLAIYKLNIERDFFKQAYEDSRSRRRRRQDSPRAQIFSNLVFAFNLLTK